GAQFGQNGGPVETSRLTAKPVGSGLPTAGSVAITDISGTLRLFACFCVPTARPACRRFCIASGTGCDSTSGTVVLVAVVEPPFVGCPEETGPPEGAGPP